MASIALSVLAILGCGALGALVGFGALSAIGWTGSGAAILAVVIGMVVATLAWAAGVALLRKRRWLR